MVIQPRDEQLLDFAFEHHTVTLDHVHRNVFTDNKDSRTARRRVSMMLEDGLLAETRAQVLTAKNNVHVPVYFATEKAARLMVERTGKLHYLSKPTKEPYTKHLAHFVGLTDLRVVIKKAARKAEPAYDLVAHYNQFDVANADAVDPGEHYKLHTTVEKTPEKTVYCCPDWAMAFRSGPHVMAMYGELERETTQYEKACRKKSPGYSGLYARRLHKNHFPGALDEFRVLFVCLHASWRDSLAQQFAQKPNPELYRFAAWGDLNEDTFFFGPCWRRCDGNFEPLFRKRPAAHEGDRAGARPVATPASAS